MNEWKKLCKICFKVGLCWTWHSLIRCLLPTHWGFFFILKTSQDLWLNWVRWRACQNTTDCRALKAVYVKSKWHIFIAFGSFAPYPYQGSASWTQLEGFPFSDSCQCPSQTKIAAPCDWQSVYCTACCAQLTLLFANGWKTSRKSRTKTWNYCAKWRIQKIIRFRGWKTKTFCHKMLGVYLFIYFKFDIAVKLLKQYDGDR